MVVSPHLCPPASGRARVRTLAALALLMVVALAVSVALTSLSKPPAPDVSFLALDGERTALSRLRGKVVLVTFWATTCTPCLRKMPELMAMHRRLAPLGLATWAVAMSYDRPDWVINYAQRQQPPFSISLDVEGKIALAFDDTRATPTMFLVDREGRIVRRWIGEPDIAAVERRIRDALG